MAQLSQGGKGILGLSFAFLGVSYLVKAMGDVGNGMLFYLSPLGWVLQGVVYVNNYWGPVLFTMGAAVLVMGLSLYLNSIQDLEAGFIPPKPGRRTVSSLLQSPLGLALRLQRTTMTAWMVGVFVLGASYGSVLGDLETYLEVIVLIQIMLFQVEGLSLTRQFLPMLMAVISMVCTIPVLLMILKRRGEESVNRLEHLLVRAVSRKRLLGSYLLLSLVASIMILFLGAAGLFPDAPGRYWGYRNRDIVS